MLCNFLSLPQRCGKSESNKAIQFRENLIESKLISQNFSLSIHKINFWFLADFSYPSRLSPELRKKQEQKSRTKSSCQPRDQRASRTAKVSISFRRMVEIKLFRRRARIYFAQNYCHFVTAITGNLRALKAVPYQRAKSFVLIYQQINYFKFISGEIKISSWDSNNFLNWMQGVGHLGWSQIYQKIKFLPQKGLIKKNFKTLKFTPPWKSFAIWISVEVYS